MSKRMNISELKFYKKAALLQGLQYNYGQASKNLSRKQEKEVYPRVNGDYSQHQMLVLIIASSLVNRMY